MEQQCRAQTRSSEQLEQIFNFSFSSIENTVLMGGATEPLYLPAGMDYSAHIRLSNPCHVMTEKHHIFYRANYFSSALHEVAHWCIAGERRRALLDYGYWYAPDGRDKSEQTAFELVERKPQALEWAFSLAAGIQFRVSNDNLAMLEVSDSEFQEKVWHQLQAYCEFGFPARAGIFLNGLFSYYGSSKNRLLAQVKEG